MDYDTESKLTDWANEPKIEDLRSNLKDAQQSRSLHIEDIDTWLDYLNIDNAVKIKKLPGRSAVTPKVIRKSNEWRYPSLTEPFLENDKLIQVSGTTHADVESARQNDIVINSQYDNQLSKVKFIDEYAKTAVDEGTVIVRTGWEEDTNGYYQINKPTIDICDYKNIYIDPTCKGTVGKANFIINEFQTSLSELKKRGIYKNLDLLVPEDLVGGETTESAKVDVFKFKDEPRIKFWVYECWCFWDIEGKGVTSPIVVTWAGSTKIRCELNPYPDKTLPFVIVKLMPNKNEIYGEADAELLTDTQDITGALYRGVLDIVGRSAAGQKGIRKQSLDYLNLKKFNEGKDYEFQPNVNIKESFVEHSFPELPNTIPFLLNMLNNEGESATGVKTYASTGLNSAGLGEVAAGVKGVLSASSKRESAIIRRLGEGIVEISKKIIAYNSVFLNETEIVRITDEEFVPINRDGLQGTFDLKVNISTSEAETQKVQDLAFVAQTLGQDVPVELRMIILAEIAKLRKMPKLAKELREFEAPKDPLQEQIKMLEIEKLKAEIAKLKSEAYNKTAEGTLDLAKTKTEEADTALKSSQRDMTDLNFVEQETGTTQERDLQKSSEQARANTQRDLIMQSIKGNA